MSKTYTLPCDFRHADKVLFVNEADVTECEMTSRYNFNETCPHCGRIIHGDDSRTTRAARRRPAAQAQCGLGVKR